MPLAIGFSGAALLLVNQLADASGPVWVVLTAVCVAVWLGVSIALYRRYRVTLLEIDDGA